VKIKIEINIREHKYKLNKCFFLKSNNINGKWCIQIVNLQVNDVVKYFNDNSNSIIIQRILKNEERLQNYSHFSEATPTLHNIYVSYDIL
jgi:hypothetical protein